MQSKTVLARLMICTFFVTGVVVAMKPFNKHHTGPVKVYHFSRAHCRALPCLITADRLCCFSLQASLLPTSRHLQVGVEVWSVGYGRPYCSVGRSGSDTCDAEVAPTTDLLKTGPAVCDQKSTKRRQPIIGAVTFAILSGTGKLVWKWPNLPCVLRRF